MELPLLSVIVVHWKTVREMAGKHLEIEKNLQEILEVIIMYSLSHFGWGCLDRWMEPAYLKRFFFFLFQLCLKHHVHCDWLHRHWLHWPRPLCARQVWLHPDEVLISPRLPCAGCLPGAASQRHELFGPCHTETRRGTCSDLPGARQQSLCKLPK